MEQEMLKQLFESNIPLVYKAYYEKILPKNPPSYFQEDLIQIGLLALWRACNMYDETKGYQFSTYAYCSAYKSMVCAMARERNKTLLIVPLSTPINPNEEEDDILTYEDTIPCSVDITKGLEIIDSVDQVLFSVGKNSDKVIQLLNEGFNQSEISERLGISKQSVHNIIKRVRERLKRELR